MDKQPAEPGHDADEDRHELTRSQADLFIVGWVSFLAASLGTMLLFAWVDPQALAEIAEPPLQIDRMAGYALGFFFLWLLCVVSAALCAWMIRTQHASSGGAPGSQ